MSFKIMTARRAITLLTEG